MRKYRAKAAICAATIALAGIGIASQANAGGIDYTVSCGVSTSTYSLRGYQAANDRSCQFVQSKVTVTANGATRTYLGQSALRLSIIDVTFGVRLGGGGRGMYDNAWGTWVP